jgi:hypothetical protein
MKWDRRVQDRTAELVQEANITLKAIKELAPESEKDPLADPTTLSLAVITGVLDAPQLKNNPYGRGKIATHIDRRGACIAVCKKTGNPMGEANRIANLKMEDGKG